MTKETSPLSIVSLIGTMSLVAAGNGLLFTYVPYVLGTRNAESWFAGAAVTAVAFGGLAGCVLAGPLIRRVGHARLFPVSLALVIIAALMIAIGFNPVLWVVARGLYGLASNINFIIAQSWINHAASNSWRGRAMSFFYMAYILCFGAGSWLFGQLPAEGNLGPLTTVFLTSLAVIPIGLTRLTPPPMPPALSMVKAVPLAWRISPVGVIGVLAAGGISMAVQGFTPIYATAAKISQQDVAALSLVMQTGLLFVQYPIGMLSDRMDRRSVILITCALIFASGLVALSMDFGRLGLLMVVFAVFAGAIESIYSLANAHANDRAAAEHFVPLSSALLVAWSAGATIVPLLITAVTPRFGPQTFIHAILILSLAYALFVISRILIRK